MKKLIMSFTLMPLMAFATTWYVDGTNGSDCFSGKSQSTAKKTIQAAIDMSVDGDMILVAPGTYAPIVESNKVIRIESERGADVTMIDAHQNGRCVTFGNDVNREGAYIPPKRDIVLKGFTLCNGSTKEDTGCTGYGGGVFCGVVEECILQDNSAEWCGGGAMWATLTNCLLVSNSAWNGGATFSCDLYNCTVVNNKALDQGGGCMAGRLYNTIVSGNSAARGDNAYRVIESDNVVETNPRFVDAGNGDYRLAADSACIDSGSNSYVSGDTDLEGCGRIVNGTVDVGCYEFEPDGGPYVEKVGDIDWTYKIKNGRASIGDGVNVAAPNLTGSVILPLWLRQCPVVAIDDKAFFGCKDVTTVTIPEGVKEVGSCAFGGCGELKDIYLGCKSLTSLDADAFMNCNWDLIVHVPADWQGRGRTLCGYSVWKAGSSDEEKSVNMTVTNVVVQYVLNSVQPEIAVPVSGDTGFVAIITEVKSSGAVSVPIEWKANYPQFETKFGTDFGKALMKKSGKRDGAGNEMFVWQDYVAGTDPTDSNSVFTASITMVGGKPNISYTPELSAEQKALRTYTIKGKKSLADDEVWENVEDGHEAEYNFFKVIVEMK